MTRASYHINEVALSFSRQALTVATEAILYKDKLIARLLNFCNVTKYCFPSVSVALRSSTNCACPRQNLKFEIQILAVNDFSAGETQFA